MYAFFTIFGFIFVSIFATVTNYIYEIFPFNRFTNFLYQIDNKGIWSKINVTVLPILIWSLVGLPILGNNANFIVSVAVNIIISSAIIYEIRYGALMLANKENDKINLISIYIGALIGQTISFMILKMQTLWQGSYLISILGIIFMIAIHCLLIIKPPKKGFFKGKDI